MHLDQKLCSELAGFLGPTAQLLEELVQDGTVQQYPDMFRELYRVAHRAHILVERCCEEKWWRILFRQACASHNEDALDLIGDLEWCVREIGKLIRLQIRQPSHALRNFRQSLKTCEDYDRCQLLEKLEKQILDLEKPVPEARKDLQLTKFLLQRIKVQVVPSTPKEIDVSLDYRRFNLPVSNGLTESNPSSRRLGTGSCGSVLRTNFLAIECARKDQETDSEAQLEEFAKQARKLATLRHPHVIKLFGFYTNKRSDQCYEGHFLMELMSGSLCDKKIELMNQHPVAVDVMIQIAKGVRYLHDNDVAHRDLKCANILVSRLLIPSELQSTAYKDYLHIKVTDFDQAKFFPCNSSDLHLQSKPNVGTTAWRAPEAYTERGKGSVVRINPKRADSYSFAMTCYEILSAHETPFDAVPGISLSKIKEAIVAGTRPPLPEDCPELLRDLIEECWRTDPLQRPAFDEICRRLQDLRSVLLTTTLSERNRSCDASSSSGFVVHNVFGRMKSMFKHMGNAILTTNKTIRGSMAVMNEKQAPSSRLDITKAVRQIPESNLSPKQERDTLIAPKVVVGLDFGTTHSGVAYAMVSNPDEILTISHWPSVGEELYHCKTPTAIYKLTPDGNCIWGYPARRQYGRHSRSGGEYFGELKQSLTNHGVGPDDHQPVVEFLRELGFFVLDYLQRVYPQESLKMDFLRWCITVPSNWSSHSKDKLHTCLVNAGLVPGRIEHEACSTAFDYMFLESDAAARHCYNSFPHVKIQKGDRVCVLDVGGANVQCVFEDWNDVGRAQKEYGASSYCANSLVEENFLKFICGKDGCDSCRQHWNADPLLRMSLLDELESLKIDQCNSIKIPCHMMEPFDNFHAHNHHLDRLRGLGSPCDLKLQTCNERRLSSLDTNFIFKPLLDGVVSFLEEQLQKAKPNIVKRLFVVGGYAKHDYLMKEIKESFPDIVINIPRNPGSAVCKGAVALGLRQYYHFKARTQQDNSSSSEGGGQGTNPDGGTRDADMNQRGQPGSSQKFYPSIPGPRSAADPKGEMQVSAEDKMNVDLPREKMLVALDFGTSQMGFAYGLTSNPGEVTVCNDHQRKTTDLYYTLYHDTLHLYSWGQKAKDDCQASVSAMGAYVSKPKLHLAVDNIEPEVELRLPAGLIIDDVITDCLREYGQFILKQLQEKFGKDFELHNIQWCLLLPSFWAENTKRRMRACMIKSGLLSDSPNESGSPYPLVTVLEAEAASIACVRSLSLIRKGFRFLVASVGGGILDMVIQEWIGEMEIYDMKEVSMSSGSLCGSSCLDLNFLSLLSMKIGSWVSGHLEQHPWVFNDLMAQWEKMKVEFSDDSELKGYTMHLPVELRNVWRDFEQNLTSGVHGTTSYESMQLTSDDLRIVFEPVVQTILEQIEAQLITSKSIDAIVLVGGFAKSPYLFGKIKQKFGDLVKTLIRLADSDDSAVLKGAVSFALHPKGIRSRIARKTSGLGMNTDFKAGVLSAEDTSNEVERFRIDMEKGNRLGVDYCVNSVHKTRSRGQQNMKFSLFSSVESYPRYTEEESVTKEWDFVVDISDSVNLEGSEPQIRITLYYGRSAIEVEAKALNFASGNLLPVAFGVGAHTERRRVDAGVARKKYGVGACKTWEKWDLPKYVKHVNEEEDLCDFSFQTFIQKGTRLNYVASRTFFPVCSLQCSLSFKVYSSSDISPVYVTDDVVLEEGEFEVDISKGLHLGKDREVSVRMRLSPTDIKISSVALNFADENVTLPVRLRHGKWESKVSLTLARQLRVVPLQPRTSMEAQREVISSLLTSRHEVIMSLSNIASSHHALGSSSSDGESTDMDLDGEEVEIAANVDNLGARSESKVDTCPPGKHHCMVWHSVFEIDTKYVSIKPIAIVAFGIVCSAKNNETGERVLIKKITDAFLNTTVALRTLHEIRLLRHLFHENIIAVKDIVKPVGRQSFNDVYIVYELMDTDLHEIILSSQTLTDDHCQYFIYQLLRGLKYVHSANVVHRDLKPSNLLLNANCDLKICDFGLAWTGSDEDQFITEYMATTWYQAPEVLLACDEYTSATSDMWSVGCIFAELLGRKPLFPGEDSVRQLKLMISIIGSPNYETDLHFIQSREARSYIQSLPFTPRVSLAHHYPRANPLAMQLMDKMLVFDPRKRITVHEALEHPYLSSLHDASVEPSAPAPFEFEDEIPKEDVLRERFWNEMLFYHPEAAIEA